MSCSRTQSCDAGEARTIAWLDFKSHICSISFSKNIVKFGQNSQNIVKFGQNHAGSDSS